MNPNTINESYIFLVELKILTPFLWVSITLSTIINFVIKVLIKKIIINGYFINNDSQGEQY